MTDERRRTDVTSTDLGQVDRSLQDGEIEGGRSADTPKLTRRQDKLIEYDTSSAEQVERRYRPENNKSGRAAANGNISVGVDQRSSTAARKLITVTDAIYSSLDEAVSLNCDRLSAGEQASAVLSSDDVTAVITRSGVRQRAARNETASDEQVMAETDATDDRRTVDETEATAALPGESEETFGNLMQRLGRIDTSDNELHNDTDTTHTDFKEEQKADSTLADTWHKAELEASWLTVMDGLLYRKIPDHVDSETGWALVLPK